MAENKDVLLAWLKDAHAMETAAIDMLEKQEQRMDEYPELQRKVSRHLEESRTQADRVEECIRKLGGDASAVKEGVGKVAATIASLTNAAADDEAVKNGLANYAFEHFEIGSYTALVEAAGRLGETEIQQTCREILEEEREMAGWLEGYLPDVTREYLARNKESSSA